MLTQDNINNGGNVDEIIITLISGEKIHIKDCDIDSNREDPFLEFCDFNSCTNAELWYHTFINGKIALRTIAAEYIMMIDAIYSSDNDAE